MTILLYIALMAAIVWGVRELVILSEEIHRIFKHNDDNNE